MVRVGTLPALLVMGLYLCSCNSAPITIEPTDKVILEGNRFTLKLLTTLYAPYRQYKKYVRESIIGLEYHYTSLIHGEERELSGVLLIPKNNKEPLPLLVYCHGTMFDQSLAPSLWNTAVQLEALPAMDGYITIIPDYPGYGVSKNQIPSYFDQEATTRANLDMLKSVKQVLEKRQVSYKKDLYILGYSQGGHAALSLLRELQLHRPIDDLNLKALVTIAGPFRLKENIDFILKHDEFATSAYVSYLFISLNTYYWKRSMAEFFLPPSNDYITQYLAKEIDLNTMALNQATIIRDLMEPRFLQEYLGTGELELKSSLRDNSNFDFVPTIPVLIIHSITDEVVPYETSHQTWQHMLQMGADSLTTGFQTLTSATHSESALQGIPLGLEFFRKIKRH